MGLGGSASYALTPAFSVGGGAAYVNVSDQAGPYGDGLIEIDAGATYRFNPNLRVQPVRGRNVPGYG